MKNNVICLLALVLITLSSCTNGQVVSYESSGVKQTFSSGKDTKKDGFLVPVYPNAKAEGQTSAESKDEENNFLMLISKDSVNQIQDYYFDELKKQGWKVTGQQILPSLVNITAQRDRLEANIMISADGDKSNITLSCSKTSENTLDNSSIPSKETIENFKPDKFNPPTD